MHVMAKGHSKLTAQGQVSVPAPIRRKLGVGPGAILEWDAEGDQVVVRRVGRFSFVDVQQALFTDPPRARTLAELKAGIGREMKRRHAKR
jgi:AbrB family looped-hinge helix DNA binding protein